jgi:integrase
VTETRPGDRASQGGADQPETSDPAAPPGACAVGAIDGLVDYVAAQAQLKPVPAATAAAYTRQWEQFGAWGCAAGRTTLPANAATLAEYIAYVCARDLAPSTIGQAIAAILARHNAHGHADELDTRTAVALLAAHARDRARRGLNPTRTRILTLTEAQLLLATCETDRLDDMRDAVVIALGINLMAGGSTLCALEIADVAFSGEHELTVTVRRPGAAGAVARIPVAPGAHATTDPVRLTRRWVQALESRGILDGPLLRSCGRGGRLESSGTMHASTINNILRRRAARAGLANATDISAHTLRATGAALAARVGAPTEAIARRGQWSPASPIVYRYVNDATTPNGSRMDEVTLY